jgi:sulfoxide reductase heme-binding subunit YedZ
VSGAQLFVPASVIELATDPKFIWYAMRGTGMVALGLLTLTTVLGMLSTARITWTVWPRFATQALHRSTALLGTTLLAAHVLTAVLHSYIDIRLLDALLPFASAYRPFWVGLGTVSVDLSIAVLVTSLVRHHPLVRDRLGQKGWRSIHLLSYLAWGLGVLHGLGIGTDARTTWGAATFTVCVGAVAAAGMVRLGILAHERTLIRREVTV